MTVTVGLPKFPREEKVTALFSELTEMRRVRNDE
jgi:hypothetical protein